MLTSCPHALALYIYPGVASETGPSEVSLLSPNGAPSLQRRTRYRTGRR